MPRDAPVTSATFPPRSIIAASPAGAAHGADYRNHTGAPQVPPSAACGWRRRCAGGHGVAPEDGGRRCGRVLAGDAPGQETSPVTQLTPRDGDLYVKVSEGGAPDRRGRPRAIR